MDHQNVHVATHTTTLAIVKSAVAGPVLSVAVVDPATLPPLQLRRLSEARVVQLVTGVREVPRALRVDVGAVLHGKRVASASLGPSTV